MVLCALGQQSTTRNQTKMEKGGGAVNLLSHLPLSYSNGKFQYLETSRLKLWSKRWGYRTFLSSSLCCSVFPYVFMIIMHYFYNGREKLYFKRRKYF